MATLTLIGEPFPDFEAQANAAAARCLAEAVAQTAPRGCSSRLIVARDTPAPTLSSPRASIEAVPMNAVSLPVLWRAGLTARPLDGEFVHSLTPLMPLRSRTEDDGSQTSVVLPHALAWQAPELMGTAQAKLYRTFAKRAAKLADVVLAPSHAVAEQLADRLGVEIRVLPLAAPLEYLENDASAGTRAELALPARYIATTAQPGEHGRLHWLLDAMRNDPSLPPLVVLHLGSEPLPEIDEPLRHRVGVVQVERLDVMGAVISGAELLVLPQSVLGAGYEVLGAIAAHVPVLHASEMAAELSLDAGLSATEQAEFTAALTRLTGGAGAEELQRLRFFSEDRSRAYSWQSTAWQLWEVHANI